MKNLNDSVSTLNGVGPKKQEALFDLDIHTIFDLLTYFPFRYEILYQRNSRRLLISKQ